MVRSGSAVSESSASSRPNRAIDIVVIQGEAARTAILLNHRDVPAHFYRFGEIYRRQETDQDDRRWLCLGR